MVERETSDALGEELRAAWHRYVDLLVPLRPALYAYCRRLSGNVWDAEDLAQDTLLRAFGQWGVTSPSIRNPRAYLLRTWRRPAALEPRRRGGVRHGLTSARGRG